MPDILFWSSFSAHHTTIPSTSAYSSITTLLASLDFAITSSDARIRVGALKLLRLFFRTHAESLGLDTSKPSDSSGQDQAKSKKKKRLQLEPSPSPSTGALSQAEMTIQSQSERKIKEMIDLCLEAENVALDVAGVRERVLRIKKVGAAVVSLSNFDAERVDEDNDIETTKRCVRLGYKWLMCEFSPPQDLSSSKNTYANFDTFTLLDSATQNQPSPALDPYRRVVVGDSEQVS